MTTAFERNVFLNCPFDTEYQPLFEAMIFAVTYCGYNCKCALEVRNGAQTRINKIYELIKASKYGIHDISRTSLDPVNNLPRFNMPFELGLFLGAQLFGNKGQRGKNCLILEKDQYEFQKYLSDISGQDIYHHGNDPRNVINHIRDWIVTFSPTPVPSGEVLIDRHTAFLADLPELCRIAKLSPTKLPFIDFYNLVVGWMVEIDSNS